MRTLTSLICTVNDVNLDKGHANVKDTFGKNRTVRMDIRKGGGPYPRVGDMWIICQEDGQWSFDSLVRNHPPVVTGEAGNTVLKSLLSTLDAMGFIDDQTVLGTPVVVLTEAEYEALDPPDPATLYVVTE